MSQGFTHALTVPVPVSQGGTGSVTGVPASILPAGTMFNLQSFTLTSATTINSATFVDTGVTVNITPTSASNKVLVRAVLNIGTNATDMVQLAIFKNGSILSGATGDTAGSRTRDTATVWSQGGAAGADNFTVFMEFLDSPATTSATTYAIYALTASPTAFGLNRTVTDGNSGTYGRTVSTITVCEVKV